MRILYFEPFFGVSGDMLLSAILSLGISNEFLYKELKKVSPVSFDIFIEDVLTYGVHAKKIKFKFESDLKLRTLKDIKEILDKSKIKKEIKENSLLVFNRLAEVEGKIHGICKEKVHFHEIGAIDTIIDIVGFFICLNALKIDKIIFGKIPLGKGYFKSEHGYMPVPAYATLELLKGYEVEGVGINGENVTPTGIALLTSKGRQGDFPNMKVLNIGYGAGNSIFENFPNLLRVTLGEKNLEKEDFFTDLINIIEFQVDDMSPELIPNFFERLFEIGVLDAYMTAIYMKKNRPGIHFTILCNDEIVRKVTGTIFQETTTIGFRVRREKRFILKREEKIIDTKYGKIRFKECIYNGERMVKPEIDDIKKIAENKKIPLKKMYEMILYEIKK